MCMPEEASGSVFIGLKLPRVEIRDLPRVYPWLVPYFYSSLRLSCHFGLTSLVHAYRGACVVK